MSSIRPRLWHGLQAADLPQRLSEPPSRYRPVPWLAWTGDLDWPNLQSQLADMHARGIEEFFLFPIYGMELPYMSAPYWQRVGQTLDYCRESQMKCWIYDEYNWPSGVCAGMVLRDHPEACEQILWVRPASAQAQTPAGCGELRTTADAAWTIGRGRDIRINVKGCDWLSAVPGYLNVLDAEACGHFLDSTHERYLAHAPRDFAETLPGFFTDEPDFQLRVAPPWIGLPYADDLLEDFHSRYGYDLLDRLTDLLGPVDDPQAQRTRIHYWRLVAERFGQAYSAGQRAWCDRHKVALTGHCLGEETLNTHVRMGADLWEVMRHFTIPGIDMLANADGFTYPYGTAFYGALDRRSFHLTCKLVHGIVRHSGAFEMLSEAYGVCDWGMNLQRQKRGFNYQVALGVTLFNDNSLVTSIADFRKYAIAGKHFTQPWWQHYKNYADYNARVAALHAEGEPICDIAVLYPRSTIWALADLQALSVPWHDAAPDLPLGALQEQLYDLLDELIRQQWHFDFIFEPVLEQARAADDRLTTEHASYRAVVLPSATRLPRACWDKVRAFAEAGGTVILAGDPPQRTVDDLEDLSGEVQELLELPSVHHVAGSGAAVAEALSQALRRPLTLSGDRAREFISSRRRIAGLDAFYVANMAREPVEVTIDVSLPGQITLCDPDTMELYRPEAEGGFTWHFEPWQGCFVFVGDGLPGDGLPAAPAWLSPAATVALDGDWGFTPEPGNMLRLQVQVKPDPRNEGAACGWQRGAEDDGWITPEDGRLPAPILPGESPWYWLRASIHCEPGAAPHRLILDNPDFLEVYVNGHSARQVMGDPLWTEENVHFEVGSLLEPGTNAIHIRARTSKYNDPRIAPMEGISALLQPVVLVGDFTVEGRNLRPAASAISPAAPWEEQGMPHFAGVGVYRRQVRLPADVPVLLHLPACADSVEVRFNGVSCGVRSWYPYVFDLGTEASEREGELEIRVHNALGHLITRTYAGQSTLYEQRSGLQATPELLLLPMR